MPVPGYGMTVGASGYVWTCGEDVARFNPKDETWDTLNGLVGAYTYSDMTGFALSSVVPQ